MILGIVKQQSDKPSTATLQLDDKIIRILRQSDHKLDWLLARLDDLEEAQ